MSSFRRASLTVLAGSVGGYAISLALTPVISRLVSPEVFGTFATVTAVASVFVGVSTLRLEVWAQGRTGDDESRGALRLALLVSVAVATCVVLVAAIGCVAGLWGLVWLAVGPMVALASWQLVGAAVLTRARAYRSLAAANFLQGAGTGSFQVAFAAMSPTVGALIGGYALGRVAWLRHLPGFPRSRGEASATWHESRGFALVAGTSAGINSLAGQAQILLPAALFGNAAAGVFAMAVRLLSAPLAIVGQAAAAAAIGEIGKHLREARPGALGVMNHGMRDLALVALLPCGVAAVFGPWLAPLVLGEEWSDVGRIIAFLSAGTFVQVVVSPFSQVLNLAGRSAWLVRWDLARLVLVSAAFAVPSALGLGLVATSAVYSTVLVVLYGVLAAACRRAIA